MKSHEFITESTDDDLFGTSSSAIQRIIYTFGKQMLHKLEQAYNNPKVKEEYQLMMYDEDGDKLPQPDHDGLFRLVCQITGAPFGKAMIVDGILREYSGYYGLNEFGLAIEHGEWDDEMVEAWDRFGNDTDVAHEEWFQQEVQTFMGDK